MMKRLGKMGGGDPAAMASMLGGGAPGGADAGMPGGMPGLGGGMPGGLPGGLPGLSGLGGKGFPAGMMPREGKKETVETHLPKATGLKFKERIRHGS